MLSYNHENMLPYMPRPAVMADRRYRPNAAELPPNCPRCDSANTKFCYYNNYSQSQPRYFCKGCRRYWTKGGSLRNVPVGGGCRKNRRGKSVRSVGDPGRDVHAFAHRLPPGPVRPDLVLDGMVGNSPADCIPCPSMPDMPATAADGSTIDLAMLYSKFLNQRPADVEASGMMTPEFAGPVEETFDSFSGSSDMSPSLQMPVQFDPSQDGLGEWSGPASCADHQPSTMLCTDVSTGALGELNFAMDPSCYDSLGLAATEGGSLVFSSSCPFLPSLTWEEGKHDSFDSLPEDAMSLHEGVSPASWSALDCQGLEALYRP